MVEETTTKELLEEMSKSVIGMTDDKGNFIDVVKMDIEVYAWFYKQADRVEEMERELEILIDVMSDADNADDLNEEVIRLKSERS